MEIERRFLVKDLPKTFSSFPMRHIEQGYLNQVPAIRVRKDNNEYFLTYKAGKSNSSLVREEINMMLDETSYKHLLKKADGIIIRKKRYLIPDNTLTIELDIFEDKLEGLVIAEVEFLSEDEAKAYIPPAWFDKEITGMHEFSNSSLSKNAKLPTSL